MMLDDLINGFTVLNQKISPSIIWTFVAAVGGVAKHLHAYVSSDNGILDIKKLLANAFISGFSGLMAAKALELYYPNLAFVIAGLSGYMGTQALDLVINLWKSRKL